MIDGQFAGAVAEREGCFLIVLIGIVLVVGGVIGATITYFIMR